MREADLCFGRWWCRFARLHSVEMLCAARVGLFVFGVSMQVGQKVDEAVRDRSIVILRSILLPIFRFGAP